MTEVDHIHAYTEGPVALILLDRPDKLNALTHRMIHAFRDALAEAQADPAVKVILIGGEGRAFSAGDDLSDLSQAASEAEQQEELVGVLQDVSRQIMSGPKPVIAAVRGYAIGAAFSWLLNCDHVFCGRSTVAFFPELKWGVSPTGGATALVPALFGRTLAMRAFHFSKRFDAEELLRLGIAIDVVEDGRERDVALEHARLLAERSAPALYGVKKLVQKASFPDFEDLLLEEGRLAVALATGSEVAGRIDDFFGSTKA